MKRKIKDKIYDLCVTKNPNVKREYEQFVLNNLDEHYENHKKHMKILFDLNWHYRVLRKEDALLDNNIIDELKDVKENNDIDIIAQSDYFDAKWYLEKYPDVKDCNPAEHYLNIGWKEFRSPGPSFSSLLYLNRYDDVRCSGMNPLLHYELIGKKDKRVSSYRGLLKTVIKEIKRIENSIFWDNIWYRKTYMSDRFYIESAAVHYFCIGTYLGMNPSRAFSQDVYKEMHPEIDGKPYPTLLHYEDIGKYSRMGYFHQNLAYYQNIQTHFNISKDINNVLFDMFGEKGKKVLLISHLLNLTGAPKVLVNLALILKENGYYPVVATLKQGELAKTLKKNGIPTILLVEYEDKELSEQIVNFANMFDIIFFNTVESLKLAHILKDTSAYKICWLHEGNMTLETISENQLKRVSMMDKVYTCAKYCNRFFAKYIDESKVEVLHYGVDGKEITNMIKPVSHDGKFIVSIVGTVSYRKGHDILFESLKYLPKEVIDNLEIRIIGFILDEAVGTLMYEKMEEYDCINYVGKVSNEEAKRLINESSLLVVPSRDDPMPVVITEAMIMGRPVLISKTVGTTDIVNDGENAFIIKDNSPEGLAKELIKLYANPEELTRVGLQGYNVYNSYLSEEVFEKRVLSIFSKCKKKNENKDSINNVDNRVKLLDAEVLNDGLMLVFECSKDNELAIFSNGKHYFEDNELTEVLKWKSLNAYLSKENKRVALISLDSINIRDFNGVVYSRFYDGIRMTYADNVWSNLKGLSDKYKLVIFLKENVVTITNKNTLKNAILNYPLIKQDVKKLYNEIINTKKCNYNVYVETRENTNDNAYQLFKYELERTGEAYFIAPQSVIDKEKDPEIKKYYLRLNSPESKKVLIRAKNIVCSWYQLKPYGIEKMKYLYPFININYVFVPHGISYDKDSFYLNKSNWGKFKTTIVSSDLEAKYFRDYNGYEDIETLGYPRMDKWISDDIDEDMVLLNPTWRKNITDEYINHLVDIAECMNGKQLVYIAHPSIEDEDYTKICVKLKNVNRNVICVHSKEAAQFNKYFKEAKYLITDYSSVAYDFAYKNGIAIYYKPLMKIDPGYELFDSFYYNHCGLVAESVIDLKKIVKRDVPKNVTKKVKAFFKYVDNKNTERVYEFIK